MKAFAFPSDSYDPAHMALTLKLMGLSVKVRKSLKMRIHHDPSP